MNVLEVRGLTKRFGGLVAVDDVSFDLGKGEFLALIGPNGAGKTTCFNMVNGYLRPDRGEVRLNGQDLIGVRPRKIVRMGVGRTFQITRTFLSMTVIENIQMALISHHRRMFDMLSRATRLYRDEAEALLRLVSMEDQAGRACSELAYGDLKRLELAVALAPDPTLLLMDEPTAGMAPSERVALMELTAKIVADRGVSVLFTEHDMDVVFAHAHRILVLNRGGLIAEGTGEEIRGNPLVQEVYLGGGTVFGESEADHA
ncbi:ABC transporter ATP-binding protein [Aquicoccus porphyridii]|uniref:ABC transporter ATP-binding protein n=1 Tax=Aquicoccus porphyridii TaxID=1852029 RepID=A0A5A9ZGH8_9RHOB|nr:ABC transporter ATP-binding protein [Aquicoccus porphyridii]KAA0916274.1 ABC transporter ATP-binding protein [Aquicoccus porphyridii]RAI53598.1 ABC transporter ATP-binding protein [Rhodobacteraceae bacterium AsT-22]